MDKKSKAAVDTKRRGARAMCVFMSLKSRVGMLNDCRFRKMLLVIIVSLFVLATTGEVQAEDKTFHYDSEPFLINEYTTYDIIEKAKFNGYLIVTGSTYNPSEYLIYDSISNETIVDRNESFSYEDHPKILGVLDEGFITLSFNINKSSIRLFPINWHQNAYLHRAIFIQEDKDFSKYSASSFVHHELELLGIERNDEIKFGEGYFPNVQHGDERGIKNNLKSIIDSPLVFLGSIILIVLIISYYKFGGHNK